MIKVNNRNVDWEEGMTVQRLIKKMNYSYPILIVKINNEHVPKEKYADTPIQNGDDVKVIHPIAGG